MIPVDQTTFGAPGGNCFSACVASILELPISEVPYFMSAPDDWWGPFKAWCVERGIYPFYMPPAEVNGVPRVPPPAPAGFAIMCGPAPRRAIAREGVTYTENPLHAVVACDGAMVHDPNPERTGLVEVHDYVVLVPLAPAKAAA